MGCLFVFFGSVFPRLTLCMVWIARPARVDAAFDTWIWPLLGVVFLPLTTLLYVVMYQVGGLRGWDWFWLALAAAFDITHAAVGWGARRQVPRYPANA